VSIFWEKKQQQQKYDSIANQSKQKEEKAFRSHLINFAANIFQLTK